MQRFIVIGITDQPNPYFPPEVVEIIKGGRFFSGGKRHHELVRHLLPAGTEWIDITSPVEKVLEQFKRLTPAPSPAGKGIPAAISSISSPLSRGRCVGSEAGGVKGEAIIVFASGDPLFFGFANTIKRQMPEADVVVFPSFNALQMLAHRLLMPYHDLRIVSLTGRPWPEFDRALIERAPKIGILTDKEHTPAAIAQRLMEYGYIDYHMYVGEHLGNPFLEKVSALTLEEAATKVFAMPNCVILSTPISTWRQIRGETPFGLPDSSFVLLDGRSKMITKMPIRLLTLQALDLPNRSVFWDVGACTGSVCIEAHLLFPHLQIEAFEIRPECEAIIHENARRHGAPGINVHIGDFRDVCRQWQQAQDADHHSAPDAVFIGGHGGHLKEILSQIITVMTSNCVIVFNSVTSPRVSTNSRELWDNACRELGLTQDPPLRIQLNDFNPIEILRCRK